MAVLILAAAGSGAQSPAVVAAANIKVAAAWVRGMVPGQHSTGAFMEIRADESSVLVGVESPVARRVELHEMKMSGDVMKMQALERLPLPAGRTIQLKPGGYHVMLLDVRQVLKAGDRVPLRLLIEAADGRRRPLEIQAEVRELGAAAR